MWRAMPILKPWTVVLSDMAITPNRANCSFAVFKQPHFSNPLPFFLLQNRSYMIPRCIHIIGNDVYHAMSRVDRTKGKVDKRRA